LESGQIFPADIVKRTGLAKAKKGFIYSEGEGKITIEF